MFGLWGLAGAAGVTLPLSAGRFMPWHGFLMAVPFMAATAWFGWTVAAFLVPISLLLVWGFDVTGGAGPFGAGSYLGLMLTMLLATVVGDRMHRVWRESEARARGNE